MVVWNAMILWECKLSGGNREHVIVSVGRK